MFISEYYVYSFTSLTLSRRSDIQQPFMAVKEQFPLQRGKMLNIFVPCPFMNEKYVCCQLHKRFAFFSDEVMINMLVYMKCVVKLLKPYVKQPMTNNRSIMHN